MNGKPLAGRHALVTGGSRGIGFACAQALGRAGASVAICARDQTSIDKAEKSLTEEGIECLAVSLDLAKSDAASAVITRIRESWGHLDILVNNLGGSPVVGPFMELDDDAWNQCLNLNIMSTVRFCREAFPLLKESPQPRVMNMGSMVAQQPGHFNPHYSAAKAALLNLSRHLASNWAEHGITVHCISPGIIHTEGWDAHVDEMACSSGVAREEIWRQEEDRAVRFVPLKRLGKPEEVGAVVAFLASDEAGFMTGSNIRIDGGRVLSIV
jgi:3-oxoacyl-[acyl-carrier protein] reductase